MWRWRSGVAVLREKGISFSAKFRSDFLSRRLQCSRDRDLASDTGAGQRGERIEGLTPGLTSLWNPRFPRKGSRWRHRRLRAKGTSLRERKQTKSTAVFFLVVRRNLEHHRLPCLDASPFAPSAATGHRRDFTP